jgi:type II secretion system protein D
MPPLRASMATLTDFGKTMQRTDPKHGHGQIQRAVATALAALVVVLPSRAIRAQSSTPPTAYQETTAEDGARYRAYKLNQLSAEAAQQRLTQFFAATPGIEIVADAPRNRVLVRANPQLLEQAGELLAKLDAPAPSELPAQTPPPPTQRLEAYPLTPASQTILSALQKQATGRPDIRIAVDERTSQALVLAPESIHSQIRDKLALVSREPRVESREPEHPAAARLPAGGSLQLRTLSADDLRLRLERLLSRPLPASTDATGQWQSFVIEAVAGAGVTATINPTTRELRLAGPPERTNAWRQVIAALDAQPEADGTVTQLVATKPTSQTRVRQVLDVVQSQSGGQINEVPKLFAAFQQPATANGQGTPTEGAQAQTGGGDAPARSGSDMQTAIDAANLAQAAGELLGPVQVSFVEGLDVIVLRGNERDVQRVMEIIQQIEQLSAVTTPQVEVYDLKNVDSRALGALMTRLYQQVLGPRIGDVSITPLVKPNALLLVGRPENVRMAIELIQRLDQPVLPSTRFEVFPLRNASAATAKTMIDQFLEQTEAEQEEAQAATDTTTLAPQAMIVADVRTNSLIVSAAPRDLTEIAALVARIDSPSGEAVDQVRVFPLHNAVATEMATVLRNAIQGGAAGTTTNNGDDGGESTTNSGSRPSALEFRRIGGDAQRMIKSGVLTGARISADARANSIVVTAPADSMDLIAALIQQLDQSPNVSAELKVFTLENGDAVTLVETLRALFGAATGNQDQQQVGGVGAGGLVRMQFSTDERTNSVIAAGTREDLAVVEAILLRLDEGNVRERTNVVYRLNNAFAQNVSDTLNQWLQTQRTAETESQVALSPFEQIEREVIIVPELASNSLVVSATPRYFETVKKIIQQLDERPPMVMIQVLIAEVKLNDTDEFGIEFGLQDSLLFDRSLLSDVQTLTTTTNTQSAGGATVTTEQQNIINANGQPGFNFNNPSTPLGNNLSTTALAAAGNVAAQGLSNFAMGRVGPEQFSGFLFSASSNSVSVLLRALQEKRRLEVLSRPQIMALDGQSGYILVGQRVPTITGVTLDQFGQTNNILYQQVGIIMQVTPRISPDGLVVMQLSTEKSEVGPEAEGIPISVSASGQIVRAPRINATTAVTTVSALSGQTVVLSGLLTNRREDIHRRVPLLADIPLIGSLFRYDRVSGQRTELLIVMTPQIIHNKIEADMIKQTESSRMSYIMTDVINVAGDLGLRNRCDSWDDDTTDAVYPTYVPAEGEVAIPSAAELLPTPSAPSLELPSADGPVLQTPPARLPMTTKP